MTVGAIAFDDLGLGAATDVDVDSGTTGLTTRLLRRVAGAGGAFAGMAATSAAASFSCSAFRASSSAASSASSSLSSCSFAL